MLGGAGATVGSFRVKLGLDINDYARGIIQADSFNAVFGEGVTRFLTNPLLGSISALQGVGRALVAKSAAILADAEATQRLADSTGASAELLQALRGRLEQAGYAAEIGAQSINKLNRFLGEARGGNEQAAKLFGDIGVSLEGIGSTDEAVARVLDAISLLPDPAQRAAAAGKLLGEEAGGKLVNAVGGGADAIRQMIEEQRSLGQVISGRTVASLADLNTTLGKTQQALEGVQTVAVAEFMAGFAASSGIAKTNIEGISGSIVNEIAPAARELGATIGHLVDALGGIDRLIRGIADYIDNFAEGVEAIGDVVDAVGNAGTGGVSARRNELRKRFAEASNRRGRFTALGAGATLDRVED